MAIVHHGGSTLREKLSWYMGRGSHRVWDHFGADEQERMLREDVNAGTSVSLLLFALVSTGLVLSIVTLLAIVALQ